MPIILGDNAKASIVDIQGAATQKVIKAQYSPKFFHSTILTGTGGQSRGLLNESRDPKMCPNGYHVKVNPNLEFGTHSNSDVKIYNIPCFLISNSLWDSIAVFDRPTTSNVVKIATDKNGGEVWLWVPIHAIQIEERETITGNAAQGTQTKSITKTLSAAFHRFLFYVKDPNNPTHEQVRQLNRLHGQKNTFHHDIMWDMVRDLRTIESELSKAGFLTDRTALNDFLQNYSLYTALCDAAERWQTQADYYIADVLMTNIIKLTKDPQDPMWSGSSFSVANALARLEAYNIPLDQYQTMYNKMSQILPADILNMICKNNLNLKLSNTLKHMNDNRGNLPTVPNTNHIQTSIPYSIEQRAAIESTSPLTLVQSGAGTGKALPYDEPVLTPNGWVNMGDLNIGDEVIGADGLPHKILRIHEQGLKPGYMLTFRDRSSIRCCGEHLWTAIKFDHGVTRERVITTEEWVKKPANYKYCYLPTVEPVQFSKKRLPIDPYFLGALIADGALAENSIEYIKSEEPVYEEVKKAAARDAYDMRDVTGTNQTAKHWRFSHPADDVHYSVLKDELKKLGLTVKSRDKFIPTVYLFGSVPQRIALLNGLFDGDGDVRTGRGYARFNTSSERLADDVLQLLWSLGMPARKQLQKNKKGDYWSINVFSGNPFKASMYAGKATGSVRPVRRSLVSAEPFDPVPMRCIEVDAEDHLYVAKDYIVTHNSTVILGRIDHMIANGVEPNDITVLSFTNAAADHIVEMKPGIHSMTIASMLHTIYAFNYPKHQLSENLTIINSIEIYFGATPTATSTSNTAAMTFSDPRFLYDFKYILNRLENNNEYTRATNFVEAHFDDVIRVLDTIGQTSLSLESIICYLQMEHLQEPNDIHTKHLIIDEVQDNSISEFIYSLKYTDEHECSLYIVGRRNCPRKTLLTAGNSRYKNLHTAHTWKRVWQQVG